MRIRAPDAFALDPRMPWLLQSGWLLRTVAEGEAEAREQQRLAM